jgi:hypothetical protein
MLILITESFYRGVDLSIQNLADHDCDDDNVAYISHDSD